MAWEIGERFKREATYVYLWLIHADVRQKLMQYCKAIILQLKINKFFKKEKIFIKMLGIRVTFPIVFKNYINTNITNNTNTNININITNNTQIIQI